MTANILFSFFLIRTERLNATKMEHVEDPMARIRGESLGLSFDREFSRRQIGITFPFNDPVAG